MVYAKCAIGKYTKATGFSIKLYRKVNAKTASKVTRIGLGGAKLIFAVCLQGQEEEEEMAAGEDATAADVAAAGCSCRSCSSCSTAAYSRRNCGRSCRDGSCCCCRRSRKPSAATPGPWPAALDYCLPLLLEAAGYYKEELLPHPSVILVFLAQCAMGIFGEEWSGVHKSINQ